MDAYMFSPYDNNKIKDIMTSLVLIDGASKHILLESNNMNPSKPFQYTIYHDVETIYIKLTSRGSNRLYEYPKKTTKVIINNNSIEIIELNHYYYITKSIISLEHIYKMDRCYIINDNLLNKQKMSICQEETIFYIDPSITYNVPLNGTLYKLYFVFDFINIAYTMNQLVEKYKLSYEQVSFIAKQFGCKEFISKPYTSKDFPNNYMIKYNKEVTEFISKPKLILLYKMGVLKIALSFYEPHNHLVIVSDKYYDETNPFGIPNILRETFSSKEEMYKQIEESIN